MKHINWREEIEEQSRKIIINLNQHSKAPYKREKWFA